MAEYVPRWDADTDQFLRMDPEEERPWVRALAKARREAIKAARVAVWVAHQDEVLRLFDEEMDRRHAEIVEEYEGEIERLRNDPDFWLRAPERSNSERAGY